MDGHWGVNATLYSPVAFLVIPLGSIELAVFGLLIMIGFSRLPDRDGHFDRSVEGYKGTWLLYEIPIEHRGIMHTIWFGLFFVGIITAIIGALVSIPGYSTEFVVAFAYCMGVYATIGHLLGDSLTKSGVQPYEPLSSKEVGLYWCRSNNTIANRFIFALGIIHIGLAFHFGIELANTDVIQTWWVIFGCGINRHA